MKSALWWAAAALLLLTSFIWLPLIAVVVILWMVWQPIHLVLTFAYGKWLKHQHPDKWAAIEAARERHQNEVNRRLTGMGITSPGAGWANHDRNYTRGRR